MGYDKYDKRETSRSERSGRYGSEWNRDDHRESRGRRDYDYKDVDYRAPPNHGRDYDRDRRRSDYRNNDRYQDYRNYENSENCEDDNRFERPEGSHPPALSDDGHRCYDVLCEELLSAVILVQRMCGRDSGSLLDILFTVRTGNN
ncbi:polyribonucleotide nucleotidyltransferase-like [Rhincodon typus]|uniref:polyribonucleotide nucleotidyltransferase-like n=1 Tax=Rhincodon typus TaxID=259920 RepID=UPI00202EF66E|nr:polyribonucleotide nucleotidyltransferase-like [Rhincodon typus]